MFRKNALDEEISRDKKNDDKREGSSPILSSLSFLEPSHLDCLYLDVNNLTEKVEAWSRRARKRLT